MIIKGILWQHCSVVTCRRLATPRLHPGDIRLSYIYLLFITSKTLHLSHLGTLCVRIAGYRI